MRTRRLDANGVTLAVTERGDERAPAVVVAHGVGSTGEFAARCWAGCVRAGYRLVTYDLRGHGASTPLPDPADQALAHHVADLAAVAETAGARVVAGTSLGAHVAAAYASAGARLDALLLAIPGWLGSGSVTARANAAVADELERHGVAATLARIAADPAVPRWVVIELDRSWPEHDPASLVAALRAVAADETPGLDALRRAAAPAGVVGLVDDPGHPFAAAEAYAAALPRAALESLTLAEWGERRSVLGDAALAACRAAIASR
ncbi:MAG TPA: alpha/beta fold hydrolase [Mycobacteriales bacterium]|nr:alpha/beta fold hydrolase [Mycobacteriales bacterium]